MKLRYAIFIFLLTGATAAFAALKLWDMPPHQDESELLVNLGINNNPDLVESSGLAYSTLIADSIWTVNDSGNTNELLLLKTNGTLQAKISIADATNLDWEAMAGFKIDGQPYLVIADVGDNSNRRKNCQLYLLGEPDLSVDLKPDSKLPYRKTVAAKKINFTYEDGPRNCEAIGVDVAGKKIWLVEKVYFDAIQKKPPGIYVLPLQLPHEITASQPPLIAKRIGDFPPRNVTGMDFSPDGKRLIIRNYVNAHLYERNSDATWESVVSNTKPLAIVLPLQRQGEAICFSPDSRSLIVTSELRRQPIWQVNLQRSTDPTEGPPKTEKQR